MTRLLLCSTFAILFTTAAAAQGATTPTSGHLQLARFAGTWDAVIETTRTDGQPMRATGVSTMHLEFGGLWLVDDFSGDVGGRQFRGHGLLGFDPGSNHYLYTWIDNMSPVPMRTEGAYDATARVLTTSGTGPGVDGKPTQVKSALTWRDDNTMVEELSRSGPQGQELPKFRVTYTRRTDGKVGATQRLVDDILGADYRGDLQALLRGHDALAAFAGDAALASAVTYWLGFAMWRLALNRMNAPDYDHAVACKELRAAVAAFETVTTGDFAADCQSAAAGCLMSVMYLMGPGSKEAQALGPQCARLLQQASTAAPDNPRVLWVLGGKQLWTPAQYGGSRALAIATYERGLAEARKASPTSTAPLAPRWGEAETLMALAYAYAHFEPLDLPKAETCARQALALQPEWHYVRDILLPGIVAQRGGK